MNTINMSEYQKLIFVNNINEDDSIKQLSKDYPFAVFFTVKNDDIHNIWNDGVRLTRFVGVDALNNTIRVGSHELKLKFDYNTGLLGIIDANKLSKIELLYIRYTKLNETIGGSDNGYDSMYQPIIISSKDNKFKLGVKFYYDINTGELSEESNVLKITPTLSFISNDNSINNIYNYFSVIGNPVLVNQGSDINSINPTWAIYEYNCVINYESHDDSNNGIVSYNIISQYDEEKTWPIKAKFYLNPISYTIYNGNNIVLNHNTVILQSNTDYNFRIEIKPNNGGIYSFPKYYNDRQLTLSISTENANVAKINGNSNSFIVPIYNSTVNFNIHTGTVNDNTIVRCPITLNIQDADPSVLPNDIINILQQSFTIELNGNINNCYFYAGFEDPTVPTFDRLIDFSIMNATGNVLWDWKNHIDEASSNSNKYFYIVIPYDFKNSILPCWDAYIKSGNTKLYVPAENRFEIVPGDNSDGSWSSDYNGSGIGGKNISMIIYKSTNKFNNTVDAKGLFYGKIQIQ